MKNIKRFNEALENADKISKKKSKKSTKLSIARNSNVTSRADSEDQKKKKKRKKYFLANLSNK